MFLGGPSACVFGRGTVHLRWGGFGIIPGNGNVGRVVDQTGGMSWLVIARLGHGRGRGRRGRLLLDGRLHDRLGRHHRRLRQFGLIEGRGKEQWTRPSECWGRCDSIILGGDLIGVDSVEEVLFKRVSGDCASSQWGLLGFTCSRGRCSLTCRFN